MQNINPQLIYLKRMDEIKNIKLQNMCKKLGSAEFQELFHVGWPG